MKSVKHYSSELDVSPRRVRKLCEQERVVGAVKVGKTWILPDEIKVLKAQHEGPRSSIPMV